MDKVPILLLRPAGDQPSSLDQSLGARLAATQGPLSDRMALEEDSFRAGDLDELEQAVHRWRAKVPGVVGATGVSESTRLGQVARKLGLLCFVANNNPVVWRGQSLVFHIGVPTRSTSAAIADLLMRKVGARRIYILHDSTDFQTEVARATASSLMSGGCEAHSSVASETNWMDGVRAWKPELVYLVYSDPTLALPFVEELRSGSPQTFLLLGRSLLRKPFIAALGKTAEGLFFVDLFHRNGDKNKREEIFFKACDQADVELPTANHGFGWDAMTLCALALTKGNPLSAVEYLESGVELEGVTGRYSFSAEDHNGRAADNPTTLSWIHQGQVKTYEPG